MGREVSLGTESVSRLDDELDRCLSALAESIRRVRRAALGPDIALVEQAVDDLAHARADLERVRLRCEEEGKGLDEPFRQRCREARIASVATLPHVDWSRRLRVVTDRA
ncbi:MAG: hypothetical protein AAF533_20300 [Acidobacteriota bacterium]